VKTETVGDVCSLEKAIKKAVSSAEAERAAIRDLVVAARARGRIRPVRSGSSSC
jgi:hypothetical protein